MAALSFQTAYRNCDLPAARPPAKLDGERLFVIGLIPATDPMITASDDPPTVVITNNRGYGQTDDQAGRSGQA